MNHRRTNLADERNVFSSIHSNDTGNENSFLIKKKTPPDPRTNFFQKKKVFRKSALEMNHRTNLV